MRVLVFVSVPVKGEHAHFAENDINRAIEVGDFQRVILEHAQARQHVYVIEGKPTAHSLMHARKYAESVTDANDKAEEARNVLRALIYAVDDKTDIGRVYDDAKALLLKEGG